MDAEGSTKPEEKPAELPVEASLLTRIAEILAENVDDITGRWSDELRRSLRSQGRGDTLLPESVEGMKTLLANLAWSVADGEAIDSQHGADAAAVQTQPTTREEPGDRQRRKRAAARPPIERRGSIHRKSKRPGGIRRRGRSDPLRQALGQAGEIGLLRHGQGYEMQDVVREYIRLRRRIWKTVRDHLRTTDRPAIDLAMYIDRLVDELMLTTVQSFYKHAVQDLERRAMRDPLTDLYNHDYFVERLREEVRRAMRHERQLTVLMIDLDNLKAINDTYGHQAGDSVLRHLAAVMSTVGRESDLRCRYAGDEFMIIMPTTRKEEGLVAAERLRHELNQPFVVGRFLELSAGDGEALGEDATATISPSVSVGIASYPEDARNSELLIAQVDAALYRAKAGGRNRISV